MVENVIMAIIWRYPYQNMDQTGTSAEITSSSGIVRAIRYRKMYYSCFEQLATA